MLFWCSSGLLDLVVGLTTAAEQADGEHDETAEEHPDHDAAEHDAPLGPRVVRGQVLDDLLAADGVGRGRVDLEDAAGQHEVEDDADQGTDDASEEDAEQDAERALGERGVHDREAALELREAAVHLDPRGVLVVRVVDEGVEPVVVVADDGVLVVVVVHERCVQVVVVVADAGPVRAVVVQVVDVAVRVGVDAGLVAVLRPRLVAAVEPRDETREAGQDEDRRDERDSGGSGHGSVPLFGVDYRRHTHKGSVSKSPVIKKSLDLSIVKVPIYYSINTIILQDTQVL